MNQKNKMHDFDEYVERRGSDCKKYAPGAFESEEVLPMWIADTDFRIPASVAEAAKERVEHECFGYPYELPEFNTVVADWERRRHGWKVDPSWVEFATGVIPAEIFFIRAMTQPGDRIVVQMPLYPPLRAGIEDNGRTLLNNRLINTNGYFTIDWEDLEKKLCDPRTRMFILCNPHNPTGRVFTREELERIAELCLKYKVLVFSDEIHDDIVYPGYTHIPFASLSKEISDLTVTGINPGKAFNVAGVRTAAVIIENKDLLNRFIISRKSSKAMGRTVVGQNVFIACYKDGDDYVDGEVNYLKGNVDYLNDFITNNIPEIIFNKPEGTYLMWLDCRSLGLTQPQLMHLFEHEGGLGLNDGSTFGPEGIGFVRLNVAVPRTTLEEGCKRLLKAIEAWRKAQ